MDHIDLIRTATKIAGDTAWFRGDSESIFSRLDRLDEILNQMRTAASHPDAYDDDLEKYAGLITELDEEKSQLEKVAGTYVDFDAEEYLQSLPGGTVASEYRLTSAGTADLGQDDGSVLYRTASAIENEYREADWINFVTAGAEIWIEDQNPQLLNDYTATREAAVFYVEKKTLPVLDVTKRASIIDNFVENIEICRLAKRKESSKKQDFVEKKLRIASTLSRDSIDESFGSNLNWF